MENQMKVPRGTARKAKRVGIPRKGTEARQAYDNAKNNKSASPISLITR